MASELSDSPLLELRQLSKHYGQVQAVRDVSLVLQPKQTLALLGPSGCGKSTVLRLIAGLERADAGSVWLSGQDVSAWPPERRHLGMVFQDYALFPHLSARRNVAYGPLHRGQTRQQAEQRAQESLALVGLLEQQERFPHQLSGGQQQRVALARALATNAPLLLLDEPLSNLDEKRRQELRPELAALFVQLEAGVILVTHDQREALSLAQSVAIMRAGEIIQHGPTMQVYQQPATAFVADFLGHQNLLPHLQPQQARRVVWVPETALELSGELWPVVQHSALEQGHMLRVHHALGVLALWLSAREYQQHAEVLSRGLLPLEVRQAELRELPDDR